MTTRFISILFTAVVLGGVGNGRAEKAPVINKNVASRPNVLFFTSADSKDMSKFPFFE
jgi:hypothetical protein